MPQYVHFPVFGMFPCGSANTLTLVAIMVFIGFKIKAEKRLQKSD
jgi:hypothetical protein